MSCVRFMHAHSVHVQNIITIYQWRWKNVFRHTFGNGVNEWGWEPIYIDNSIANKSISNRYRIIVDPCHCWWGYTMHLNWPLTRYVTLQVAQVAHAPGMPGTFSLAADFKGNRLLAIPTCITARAWRTCRDVCRDRLPAVTGKTFPAFPAHAHPQFCVSGKRPMDRKVVKIYQEVAFIIQCNVSYYIKFVL